MKKLSLLILGLTFTLSLSVSSCSNEDVNFQDETSQLKNLDIKNEDEIERLFQVIYTSADYQNFKQKSYNFHQKLNYLGNLDDFEGREDLLNWISNNLELTSFTHYQEAVELYSELEDLDEKISLTPESKQFNDLCNVSTEEEIFIGIERVYFNNPDGDVTSGNNQCLDNYNRCKRNVAYYAGQFSDDNGRVYVFKRIWIASMLSMCWLTYVNCV